MERITNLKEILCNENNKVKKLKHQVSYQRKCREKKMKHLHEYQKVMMYESSGRPTLLVQYPDLHEHIHECIEFGAADKKRRKEVIKVRTICHFQEELNSKYNEYLSCTTLSNYLLPSQSNSITARAHHHPANIAISSVSRDEKKNILMSIIVLLLLKEQNNLQLYFQLIPLLFHKMTKPRFLSVSLQLEELSK